MADKNVLEAIKALIKDPELEYIEERAAEFNVFVALRRVEDERTHSDFLAFLMSPLESHGFGTYFLRSFLMRVSEVSSTPTVSLIDIDSWDLDDTEVLREWRNIDILIRCESEKCVWAVENKIQAREHGSQLRKYREIVDEEYRKYKKFFVYLTPGEGNPSDDEYIRLSYSDISSLLGNLLKSKKGKVTADVVAFVEHYRDALGRYIMEDSRLQEQCVKVYKRHRAAIDLIWECKPDDLQEIRDILEELIQKDSDLVLEHAKKGSIIFIPKSLESVIPKGASESWIKSPRMLVFWLETDPESRNTDLKILICPGPQETRKRLHAIAKGNKALFRGTRKLGVKWGTIYKRSFATARQHESMGVREKKALFKTRLEDFKKTDLPKIEREMKKLKRT